MTDRDKQIAEFLARNGATKCPPAESFADQAGSVRIMRRVHERELIMGQDEGDEEVQTMERGAQDRYLEIQGVRR